MKDHVFSIPPGIFLSTIKIQQTSLEVFYYLPQERSARGLLFLFDGVHRDASGICAKAISISEQSGLALVAPFMPQRKFPKWRYQHAGISRNNVVQEKHEWTSNYIQQLIDYMLEHSQHTVRKVVLFGHSAGGQLLSRICAYSPLSDVNSVIIANPSSYVMPLLDEPAPYGFHRIFSPKRARSAIRSYLSAPMTICLGTKDTEDLHLSRTKASMRQGNNRLERGRKVFLIAQEIAQTHQLEFNWNLLEIPDIGHSSRDMLNDDSLKNIILNR